MKVYVYKQYRDDYAYGEEVIEVYAKREDAEAVLREDIETRYHSPWDEIPEEIGLEEDDTFESDYVSIGDGSGNIQFAIIEEKEVK